MNSSPNTPKQVDAADQAIRAATALSEYYRKSGRTEPLTDRQMMGQFRMGIEMILGEGGYYAPDHAARALRQTEGDILEASALLRAERQTIPRRYTSATIDTRGMIIERRISSAFREIPGGQVLGPTLDYTQRILEPALAFENMESVESFLEKVGLSLPEDASGSGSHLMTKVSDILRKEGLMKATADEDMTVVDMTRQPMLFPVPRSGRLQMLAMAQTGALLCLGYSGQRGFGGGHGTVGELRVGRAVVTVSDRSGRSRSIGLIRVTEAEMITRIEVKKKGALPHMVIGYGLCFGQNETKAISMGGIDRAMRKGNDDYPCQSQEFVLHHTSGPDAWGMVTSQLLPDYTSFESEQQLIRQAISRAREKETTASVNECSGSFSQV